MRGPKPLPVAPFLVVAAVLALALAWWLGTLHARVRPASRLTPQGPVAFQKPQVLPEAGISQSQVARLATLPPSQPFGASASGPAYQSPGYQPRPPQYQTFVTRQSAPATPSGPPPDLDRMVQDYNNALQRAKDAERNVDATDRMRDGYGNLAIQEAGTPQGQQDMNKSNASLSQLQMYGQECVRCLQDALGLQTRIKSYAGFDRFYQEAELAFTWDQIPVNLQGTGADRLRYIRRR